jgi:methyl-accepting chemotaxis protein
MFALKRKSHAAFEIPPPQPAPELAAEPHLAAKRDQLLQSWMALAEMQQRIITVLVSEVAQTSGFVETEADALSQKFQMLAASAQVQTARVQSLTALAQGVVLDEQSISVDDICSMLERTLGDVVVKILLLSRDSMSMVYALDSLSVNVDKVEQCMVRLDAINRTTNMLALNARIEAERAGDAGNAFRVVANEVRELSKSTDSVAASMSAELKLVRSGLAAGRETLKRVATLDMSENIMAKDRLDVLITALAHRSQQLRTTVESAIVEAETISGVVDEMVTGIQFQDRTKQRLEHVIDTLNVLGEAVREITSATAEAAPELARLHPADLDWVKTLMARYTMSEMRERFVAQVIDGHAPDRPEQAATSGSTEIGTVELF